MSDLPDPPEGPPKGEPDLVEETSRVGTIVAERYELLELIGLGGMGAVYRARHVHMRKAVALKVLHREMTTRAEVVARFEREAVAAGRIQHLNVVSALDFGRLDEGSYYLVLDYVEGETLSESLAGGRHWALARCLPLVWQVACALEAAHAQGVVHRDLKPENVMLVERAGGTPLVKVLDFGIAKVRIDPTQAEAASITQLGVVFGTPEYMSPEQAMGQVVDERGDLYALGLLLYRMLVGRPPFRGETVQATLMQQVTLPMPPLPEGTPPELVAILERLLAKEPDARFASAAEVRLALSGLMLAQGIQPPESAARDTPELDAPPDVSAARASGWAGRLDRSLIGLPITLLGNRIPMWRFVLLGGVITAFGVGLSRLLAIAPPPASGGAIAPLASRAPVDPTVELEERKVARQIASALVGDLDAARELERRPARDRSTQEWLALARLYSRDERLGEALTAYARVLDAERALASDVALRRDVARAAQREDLAAEAVRFAARYLGAFGADLLYFIWVRTKDVTPATQLAKDLLYERPLSDQATPALRFLLRWRSAISCDDYRSLLVEAAVSADERATTLLARTAETECALEGPELDAAQAAAASRPAPNVFFQ